MDEELLVRLYNVGLGDCIYVRVPDGDRDRHLLIDCGNKFSQTEHLEAAVADLKTHLPETDDGKKRLDLLVVTHAHEDHVRGFDVDLFAGIQIDRIWLSAGMDPDHPQAEQAHALQEIALASLQSLTESPSPGLAALADELLALTKADGMEAVLERLPEASGIKPTFVHAGTPADEIEVFDTASTRLRILAPMENIDQFYLGRTDTQAVAGLGGFAEAFRRAVQTEGTAEQVNDDETLAQPTNISPEDFELLRSHLTDSALSFVLKAGHLVNNTSVVLLLEWQGRRLLFTGDAEVNTTRRGQFEIGKPNYSWNVMWAQFRDELEQPLDFLKVGHHGSYNATPWTAKKVDGKAHPINQILDHLLPVRTPGSPERYAVVSTERTSSYEKIPQPELMVELGKRASNTRIYSETPVQGIAVPADLPQPQRTDLEHQHTGEERVAFVDVRLAPVED